MSLEDKLYSLLKFYKKLPLSVKNFLGNLYRILPKKIRYGTFYFQYHRRLKNNEISSDELLHKQFSFVNQNIPFYKNKKFKLLNDYPIISKDYIKQNFYDFINRNGNKLKANTGGSSGNPFSFFLEKGVSRPKEKAHFHWFWGQFGYEEGDKVLMIRGESLSNNMLYEFQSIENKLAISCYLLNENNINDVIKVINNFKPQFIHAYPSAIKNFMRLIEKKGFTFTVDAVFLGSEGMLHSDFTKIANFFNAKIAHWYGHSERLVFAGNCPFSNELHIHGSYGLIELVDENQDIIEGPNQKGRIIATGFDNKAMPFIRYDTGDEAEYSEILKCKCGHHGPSLKRVYGRSQDYIFLNDNTKVSLTAFIFGQHFSEFSFIDEFQIIQKTKGEIRLKIVTCQIEKIDEKIFIHKLRSSVDMKIKVKVDYVNSIEKTLRGKHVFLKQQIKE